MKKIFIVLGIVFMTTYSHAAKMEAQFRVWKSSFIGLGSYAVPVMLSSAPILFFMDTSSPIISAGSNYLAVFQSSGDIFTTDATTKAYISENADTKEIGVNNTVQVSSHAYIMKQGGANASFLWDYIGGGPNYRTPYDGR